MRTLALALLALLAGCGGSASREPISDWERKNQHVLNPEARDAEAVPPSPAFPKREDLVEFDTGAAESNRYYVDRTSLNVQGSIVRFVLVVRAGNADNISFEALECKRDQYRSYARGTNDGKWIVRPTEWRPIQQSRAEFALHRNFFCPTRTPIRSPAEGVEALKAGKHVLVERYQPSPFGGGSE